MYISSNLLNAFQNIRQENEKFFLINYNMSQYINQTFFAPSLLYNKIPYKINEGDLKDLFLDISLKYQALQQSIYKNQYFHGENYDKFVNDLVYTNLCTFNEQLMKGTYGTQFEIEKPLDPNLCQKFSSQKST